ncbi:MAG: hypothetical protein KDK91_23895, partial [Gammaproteobacteria bacterium]|nr:hypothetical protein [Gammaproteobacteria bacterium]
NALNHTLDVWVPSQFNVDCFRDALERPVFRLPHPLHEPGAGTARPPARGDDWLGVGSDDLVFYSIFEWQERKNPEGLLEAFMRAFAHADGPVLIVKSNPGAATIARQTLDEVRRRVGSAARVLLRCEAWSDAEISALHDRGDCYVSLHFGEGWGYPVFDAASRGTPVVATGYSGPLDFLGVDNPGLVDYDLAAVSQPYVYYNRLMHWAHPRLEHAIDRLRWVREQRDEALCVAARTREAIRAEFSLDAVGRAARQRLLEVLARINPRRARRLHARLLGDELRPEVPIPGTWYDADYFDRGLKSNWREGYHWPAFEGLFRDTARFLVEIFSDAQSFLDAGCAKGFLVRALRDAGKDAWGCDHSGFAIGAASEAIRAYLIESCVTRFCPARHYDVVVAMNLLESLTEEQASAFLSAARGWTDQALIAVILCVETRAEDAELEQDSDLSRVIRRPRSWWQDLFRRAGWHQDALHRVAERACQAHPLPARMGWQLFVYSPGRPRLEDRACAAIE